MDKEMKRALGIFFTARDDTQTFRFTRRRHAWRLTVVSKALTDVDLKPESRRCRLVSRRHHRFDLDLVRHRSMPPADPLRGRLEDFDSAARKSLLFDISHALMRINHRVLSWRHTDADGERGFLDSVIIVTPIRDEFN